MSGRGAFVPRRTRTSMIRLSSSKSERQKERYPSSNQIQRAAQEGGKIRETCKHKCFGLLRPLRKAPHTQTNKRSRDNLSYKQKPGNLLPVLTQEGIWQSGLIFFLLLYAHWEADAPLRPRPQFFLLRLFPRDFPPSFLLFSSPFFGPPSAPEY